MGEAGVRFNLIKCNLRSENKIDRPYVILQNGGISFMCEIIRNCSLLKIKSYITQRVKKEIKYQFRS